MLYRTCIGISVVFGVWNAKVYFIHFILAQKGIKGKYYADQETRTGTQLKKN